MDLTVVVAARNEEEHLADQLDALLAQEWDGAWEVVVVDNGSEDNTPAILERYRSQHERLRTLSAGERPSKSHAVEVGVNSSSAPLLAFTDADDVVAPGWVAAMAEALARDPVVTGPVELDRLNPPWLAGSRGRAHAEGLLEFHGLFPTIRGNNYGVRRSVLAQVGLPEAEHYPVDDVEFSLRCWFSGVDIALAPEALVHYRYRPDWAALVRQGWNYGTHRPLISRRLRQAGRPRPARLAGWKSWLALLAALPTVASREGRARVAWIAAVRFGHVVGSVRHRTIQL